MGARGRRLPVRGAGAVTMPETEFDRGLLLGLVVAVLGCGALLWAAAPTRAETLDRCTDIVWEANQ